MNIVDTIAQIILGWPLIIYVAGISILCTIAFGFVQFRYFARAWKEIIFPPKKDQAAGDMTPFQAFLNTLSSNLGNASVAGMATAIHLGGPGAAFWVALFGLILMSVRFAEVYLSTYFAAQATERTTLGGPMLYLHHAVGGKKLASLYAFLCFFFGLTMGNAAQANSISVSLYATWGVPVMVTAVAMLAFSAYIVFGGSARIAKLSEGIVPIKVVVFFVSTLFVLVYHYASLWSALKLICVSAFQPTALAGGAVGFSIQQAMRFGMSRSIFATESGLGTAAILFGFTGSREPVQSGLMAMISTFVSTLVCLMVAVCIIASGAWTSGLDSTALTIAAYNTALGPIGGWLVSFLAITFGAGVLVAYAYIVRAAWLSITNGRYESVFFVCFCAATFIGSIMEVKPVWYAAEIVCGCMLFVNLFGIVCLMPIVRRGLRNFGKTS